MLKNIKSIIIRIIIISQLDDSRKLKLFKYNKELQNILNISLSDYIAFSGRYIIYELNGEIKEFNNLNGNLIYEGKYLNRKRNGKGKEYDIDGKINFEGEYLNGQKWNDNCKEYYDNGQLKFIEII